MLNIKFFFNLESRQKKDGTRLVFFNLNYGYYRKFQNGRKQYIPMRISTRKSIEEKYWNKDAQKTSKEYVSKKGNSMNLWLDKVQNTAVTILENYYLQNSGKPDPTMLKKMIEEKLGLVTEIKNESPSIIEFIDLKITERASLPYNNKSYWSKGAQVSYRNLANAIKTYEEITKKTFRFELLDETVYWDFFKVINEHSFKTKQVYLTTTTMAKYCKNLKAILNLAKEEEIDIGFKFSNRKYKIHEREASCQTYLDEQQIEKLCQFESQDTALNEARDFAVVALFTGLRFQDLLKLHEIDPIQDFDHDNRVDYFTTKIRKSRENKDDLLVTIPIFSHLRKILDRNDKQFPKFSSEPKLRKNFNRLMKELEFDSLVKVCTYYYGKTNPVIEYKAQHTLLSPHDCRRSFVTNLSALGVHDKKVEYITHPKLKANNIIDRYNKASLLDKARQFVDDVRTKDSKLFYF